jgi:hypothetical protein
VLGIDFVEKPLEEARRKAEERGVQVEFLQMDALILKELDWTFNSVIDCGLFHVLSDEDRRLYVEGLAHVTEDGGRVFLMCFSDEEPGDTGPRRIAQGDLREAFAVGWTIESITATHFETNPDAAERHFGDDGPRHGSQSFAERGEAREVDRSVRRSLVLLSNSASTGYRAAPIQTIHWLLDVRAGILALRTCGYCGHWLCRFAVGVVHADSIASDFFG